MPHKKGTDRNQLYLLTPSLEDFISEDNPVRVIEAYVDTLDFEKLKFKKIRTKEKGCRPYHPADLLKLYIYGYSNRIRTSRKLEWECIRNIELMWLMRNLQPSARTIAYFRKDNKRAFKLAFRQFIALTIKWDLVEGELLASDGSKLRAVNSKKNNYNENKIAYHFRRIDDKISEYLKELDHQDKLESGIQKENVNKTLVQLKERRRKYEELEKKCTKSPISRGRIIQRSLYQDAVDLNNQRVIQEKEKYRKRQEMVEHPFGIVKRQWGFDHVLMKGIDKVEAEANLIFLCYNIKRVIKILGFKEFMKRLLAASLFSLKNGFNRTKIRLRNFFKLDLHFNFSDNFNFSYCI